MDFLTNEELAELERVYKAATPSVEEFFDGFERAHARQELVSLWLKYGKKLLSEIKSMRNK